ncbi:aminopeptidase N-like [Centruroides sculpturatus]|uniref:aminopeptidase N-like n=1 Tax=Centruroides sculpturatus TaxID=218467 RepID=UPI000C6D7A7E|nr:aminopeptidase N-like [Centruroides sculpturatus]
MKNGNVANGNGHVKNEEKESYKAIYKRIIFQHKLLLLVVILIFLLTIVAITVGVVMYQKFRENEDRTASSNRLKLPNFRLPSTIFPRHYILEIKTYLTPKNFKFEGKERITLECVERTDQIFIHSLNLTIDEEGLNLQSENKEDVKISYIKHYPEIHLVLIKLEQHLNAKINYYLSLNFTGKLLEDGLGFYYSSYKDSQNKEKYLAATQLEPIYARKAFPCFDEPAMKAKFDIRLVRWKNMTSLSNMPKMNTISLKDEWDIDVYQTSMKMSTYIVAFAIGNFTSKSNNKISIWSRPEKISLANFSLSLSPKIMNFFENLFDVPYAAPKLDMATIKSKNVIAMENWGLVFYPESQLLYNETTKIRQKKEIIATTISHEIAHQWFGNLVTPKWWSHIWLSEGFATYMEHIASTSFFPQWNKVDKTVFNANGIQTITKHCEKEPKGKYEGRVALQIKTFQDVNTRDYFFNSNIYDKGAMIIRMAHHIIGNESFWKGVTSYLKGNAYNNVEEKTLWEYLSMAQPSYKNPKEDLMERMTSWTNLLGQPIVSVIRNFEENTASFSQISCLSKANKKYKKDLWQIPISYISQDHSEWNPRIVDWLTDRNKILKNMPQKDKWILVNGNSIGFYIVNYDKRNWKLLAKQLQSNHNVFSPTNRFKLLNDAVTLYTLDYIEFATLLDFYLYIPSETELVVLKQETFTPLMEFSYVMHHMTEEKKWKLHVGMINILKSLRYVVFNYLCENGYEDCLINTRDLFTKWKNDTTKIKRSEAELLNFCAIIKYGTREDWNYVHDLYLVTKNELFLIPLPCTKDRGLFKRLFGIFLRKEKVITIYKLLFNIFDNENLWIEFLQFFSNHFKRILDIYRVKTFMDLIETYIENELIFNQFESIFRKHIDELNESDAKIVKENLRKFKRIVIKRNREIASLTKWLKRDSWLRIISVE